MEPTSQKTKSRTPKRKYNPAMVTEERLEALRAIRGMWKNKAVDIMQRIEEGREDREIASRKV